MSVRISAVLSICAVAGLGACAQPEPEAIQPEPVYDKYGAIISDDGGECEDGYYYSSDIDECLPYDRQHGDERNGQRISVTGAPIN